MRRLTLGLLLMILTTLPALSQNGLLTVAEKSNFESTSRYDDVKLFINQLLKQSPYIRVETIARTLEGREVPLLIIANPMPKTPKDLENDKRIVVYVQANIHPGEVEGKEAVLMFARDLLKQKNPEVLKDVVLLICPDLNADGNEKISTQNRTNQNGPKNGVGVRYNSQFLDLNRDAIKIETPEIKGVITNILNKWDPSITMDCHTTNGSYHMEPITFTWIMNPNCDRSLINYMRDKMMPEMSGVLLNRYKTDNIFYGEFVDQADYSKGWISYAAEPRYLSNYIGVRNRLGILNENYVYADFKTRVIGCYYLIHSLVDYASLHREEIKGMLKEVDQKTINRGLNPALIDSFAVVYQGSPTPKNITIKAYETYEDTSIRGYGRFKKSDKQVTVTVPYIADYYPVKSVKLPFAYLINVINPEVIENLMTHGITVEKLNDKTTLEVEKFQIDELKAEQRLNQGHYTNTIKGKFIVDNIDFDPGVYVVRTSQKLGYLVSYLLEPQSDDGYLTWNFFDRYLVPQWGRGYYTYPVYRVMKPLQMNTSLLSK